MTKARFSVHAVEMAGTAVAFSLASLLSSAFSLPNGLSFLFPPAGVSLAAGAAFGVWGVAGVVVGVFAVPWGAANSVEALLLFALANGLSAAIPAWALRKPEEARGGTGRRLRRFLNYGAVLNNLASAVIGCLALVWLGRVAWGLKPVANAFLLWWTSDLAAALAIGLPLILALRPSILLTAADQEMMSGWLRSGRAPLLHAAFVAVAVLAILAVDQLGLGFPHWLAIPLVIPIGLAAMEGGAGPAILMSSLSSLLYLVGLVLGAPMDPGHLAGVLAPAYTTVGILTFFALTSGWLGGRNRRLLDRVRAHEMQLERDFDRTVASLAAAIEAKDPTTEGHVQRVAHLAVLVGRKLGYEERQLRVLRYGAMLHDVGKIGVPEAILNKPGGLTQDEKEAMEQHVEIGLRIIRDVEVLCDVDPLIRYHQERWDGARTGVKYPGYFGLRGEEIPEGARVLSVVDAFDAITHDRPYRAGNTVEVAVAELRQEAGRQFDPHLVEVLAEVLKEGEWLLSEPFASAPVALRTAAAGL